MPIYDLSGVQEIPKDFREVLVNLDKYPEMNRDIPKGSCAVVAYTVNSFTKQNESLKNVSTNIHMAMYLGQMKGIYWCVFNTFLSTVT